MAFARLACSGWTRKPSAFGRGRKIDATNTVVSKLATSSAAPPDGTIN
eukprot:CAMPEP_0195634410 /NCGR_PEP_ID=MMETSP0815-20121206/22685_1 /TAXON_ID=97485 /ORGANISM="Prymnesium parvum, Strain Texoma1" /LENGTH=47 /DNA_ID= /DNA_START= /DNA_END= /DNA_ORIENTATION=